MVDHFYAFFICNMHFILYEQSSKEMIMFYVVVVNKLIIIIFLLYDFQDIAFLPQILIQTSTN